MKKVMAVLCFVLVATLLPASSRTRLIQEFDEFTVSELRNSALEMTSHIRDLRDEYLLEVLYEDWEDGAWVNDMKYIYTYDASSYLIETLQLNWDEDEWQNSLKMVMTNNTEGYPIEMMYQMWEPTAQIWMDMMMVFYTYDANWNMTEMLMQMWFGTAWINAARYTMTYNADNNTTYVLEETWDFPNGTEWENDQQEFYTYDGLFLEEILEESWENGTEWIWSGKLTYTLAGNNHPADRLELSWNGGGYWDNQRFSQYTYDGDWNEIEDYEQEWINGDWVNFETHFYTYDDGLLIERLTHRWEPTRNWVNYHKQTMSYGTLGAENNSIQANYFNLCNYPNPFNPETTISFSTTKSTENTEIVIYNLKGQKVKVLVNEKLTSDQHTVVWNGKDDNSKSVSSGVYFYKMRSGNYAETKKMILMK